VNEEARVTSANTEKAAQQDGRTKEGGINHWR